MVTILAVDAHGSRSRQNPSHPFTREETQASSRGVPQIDPIGGRTTAGSPYSAPEPFRNPHAKRDRERERARARVKAPERDGDQDRRILRRRRHRPYVLSFDEDCFDATLTESGGRVESWVAETYRIHRSCRHPLVVGLDVEWRPAPVPGPVAVLQICIDRRCLVFQILYADYVPDALSRFLADPRFTFVGVGVRDDAAKLRVGYGLEVPRAVDLRALAADTLGKPYLRRAGLQALVREVMGVQMDKPHHVRVSDCDTRNLSEDQFKYACADAFASMEVGWRQYTCKCNCDGA